MAECVSAEKKNNFEEIRLVCYNSMFFSWQFSNKGHILSHIYCQRLRLLDYCCCNTANFRELPLWTQSSSLLLGLFPLKLKGPWWEWAVLYISSFICFTWCCNWRLDLAASWCFSCNCCSQSFCLMFKQNGTGHFASCWKKNWLENLPRLSHFFAPVNGHFQWFWSHWWRHIFGPKDVSLIPLLLSSRFWTTVGIPWGLCLSVCLFVTSNPHH